MRIFDWYTSFFKKSLFQTTLELAEQGNINAWYDLGVMYIEGKGVTKCVRKGTDWLKMAASAGHADANNALERLIK